ncbi:unnamed protein product [Urochloa humidicola]
MNSKVDTTSRKIEEMHQSLDKLSEEQGEIKNWKPQLEGRVTDLQKSVSDLKLKVDLFIHERPKREGDGEVKIEAPASTRLGATTDAEVFGQDCHRPELIHRREGVRVDPILTPPPVKGAQNFNELTPASKPSSSSTYTTEIPANLSYAVPHIEFPKFDGTNPKIWVKRCENYFDVMSVPLSHWVRLATMNFVGSAAFWMQSIEMDVKQCSWDFLCKAVVERFERDQHNQIIRQFFHIKQSGSVAEYIELFDELIHQLLAHDPYFNPSVITTRFVDGLQPDIKKVVLVQRPKDLDTASSIAILQEEVLMGYPCKEIRKSDEFIHKAQVRSGFHSPGLKDSSPNNFTSSSNLERKTSSPSRSKPQDDKLTALMNYRRAKGLCFKCGTKWGPNHKCPDSVPLHMVEELWQMLEEEPKFSIPSSNSQGDSDSGEDLMSISVHACNGTTANKTIRLQASIGQHKALILVDSGSSHSFISEQFASNFVNWHCLKNPIQVKVANGGILHCTHEIVNCEWLVQGIQFQTTFKILPLKCYDAILGIDWLSAFSPMKVQWAHKWFSFRYNGSKIKIQGLQSSVDHCLAISGDQLTSLQKSSEIWCIVQVYCVDEEKAVDPVIIPEVQPLVNQYTELFVEPSGIPPSRAINHSIPLINGAQPFKLRPYRYTPAQKTEIEQQVQKLLRNHMVQESKSPYASPLLLVKKKTGEWRLCVDFRRLNSYTIKNRFPLPIIEELFEKLFGARWFTTLDLRSGFHQILLEPEDQHKTAFQTHFGHFEYKVMPYGLTGAPATFQAIMNHILAPLLRKCVVVFIDDILIYSKTKEEHAQHIKMVFDLLKEHQFKVRLSKCTFAQTQLKYLGHVITAEGVATDPKKVQDVLNWKSPTSVKELRSFLGLAGYYRRFVKHFGEIAKPLTDLLKKGQLFTWTSATEQSFQALKEALTSAPVLSLPDFNKPFVVETDASEKGIGAVLQQDGHPIAYISRALGPKNQGLSTYEKESLAILMAIDHWRSYLQPAEFIIQTDHRSLTHLDDQRLHSYWQQKAMAKLMGLQYKICYKKGTTNNAADALSRMPQAMAESLAISIAQPTWLQKIAASYSEDEKAKQLLSELAIQTKQDKFSLSQGIIKYKDRIWLGHNEQFQLQVMEALHASPLGGHSGYLVTYTRIKKLFFWPHMKSNIKQFVASCAVCQQAKAERVPYPGLLQPLEVPDHAWQIVTLDFIEGLPTSSGYNCILVVVDKFSKNSHFIRMKHPFTALSVAQVYFENVYKLHGMPKAMVSDRDRIFTSQWWQELFKLTGTSLKMSSAYHPQSDGQTERVNQCLETYLRCFIQACPSKWSEWLSLAEFWYNTNFHSALNKSPFEVLYGHEPRHFGIDGVEACAIPDLAIWLKERKGMIELLQQQLARSQLKMKVQADRKRSDRSFAVGESVWLKLQPYIQNSLATRSSYKLSFRYFGPFIIESKVGAVAYKLALPSYCRIHPVFHVSLLKKVTGSGEVG